MKAIDSEKARLRRDARAARRRLPAAERRAAAEAVSGYATMIAQIAPGRVVSCFATFGDELDTQPLMEALNRLGVQLALPVVGRRRHPLVFRRWQPGDLTAPGPFSIPQPLPEAPKVDPTIYLVPLLLFDRRGYRLGYGGGFYDRTLSAARSRSRILALGLAFAAQERPSVPAEAFDEPLDGVLTERQVIRCTGGLRAAALPW